jgi:hypothetical protein
MAQQASPNVIGQMADLRAQLKTQSIDVVIMPPLPSDIIAP